jgi:hypothetical protein
MVVFLLCQSCEEDLKEALEQTAIVMFRDHVTRCDFKTSNFEGSITTAFRYYNIGAAGGMQFDGRVEMEKGTLLVRFLLDTADLTQGEIDRCPREGLELRKKPVSSAGNAPAINFAVN